MIAIIGRETHIMDAGGAREAARQAGLLRALGLETAEARAAAIERAKRLYDRIFMLAEEIVANHPEVVD